MDQRDPVNIDALIERRFRSLLALEQSYDAQPEEAIRARAAKEVIAQLDDDQKDLVAVAVVADATAIGRAVFRVRSPYLLGRLRALLGERLALIELLFSIDNELKDETP